MVCRHLASTASPNQITAVHDNIANLASSTSPISQGLVAVILLLLFALLTLEKAHRVLVALAAVSLVWGITYFTPFHLITFEAAAQALDLNVLLLLASMMALVGVLKKTGVFTVMIRWLARRSRNSPQRVMALLIWFTAVASAFLDNVTTVIFATPIALGMAAQLGVAPVAFLMPMIMAANIGGTATLIGDPPNIMIGSGAGLSFGEFLRHLAAPVLVMVTALQLLAARWFREHLTQAVDRDKDYRAEPDSQTGITDPALLRAMIWIGTLVLIGFLTHGMTGMPAAVPATMGAAAVLVVQDLLFLKEHRTSAEERTHGILKIIEHEIEWPTLVFFALLFILVGAAVETGLISTVARSLGSAVEFGKGELGLSDRATLLSAALLVLWTSGILSGLIDNIPFVAVSIPVLQSLIPTLPAGGTVLWWALSLGACLGGNGTPIGASANVTTLDLAARRGAKTSFIEFASFGGPVTALTLVISSLWLAGMVYLGFATTLLLTLLVLALWWLPQIGSAAIRRG